MSLSQFRGRVVLLGFEDSECTTVCPLTTQSMVLAKELLGKAGDVGPAARRRRQPGRDQAVSDVLDYSRVHGMVNQWDFLTGSARPAQGGMEVLQHRGADRVGCRSTTRRRCT